MIRLIQRRLIIPRGDTGSFSIPVLSKGGTNNIAVFTIFDETTRTKMFQKIISGEGDVLTIAFTHSDTVNLKPGKYVWDIKYYKNPEYIDDELVNGEEINSYYAGFSLPVCEIRETADNYLVSPEAPTATLSPEQLEIVTGAIHSLNEAIRKTQENVEHYPEIRDEVWYAWDAELGDYVNTGVRANGIVGNGIASAVLNDDYTLTLNFTDGTSFTSTSIRGETGNGIDDIVLNNDFTLTITYTDGESYTTPSIRGPIGATPQFSIGTVQDGAVAAASITGTAENPVLNLTLPNAHVPTRVSQLENDAGYLTEHQDLSDYVQKTDYATSSDAGIIIPNNTSLRMIGSTLGLMGANSARIKSGTDASYPIMSNKEHESTFYGLAKAAGDTTQSQSSNAVGTYTEEAKTAIQTMLDVPSNEEMNTAIGEAIGQINSFDMAVVQTLPTQDISTHTIYLVPKTGETNDVYDEYIYINDAWEMVGNTQIDLSNYVQETDYATANDAGVVKIGGGIGVGVDGSISVVPATKQNIKDGQAQTFISSNRAHTSTFYGLAKAAGDTTQSQSDNSVGQYTDEAKTAIQTMLDVPSNADIPTQVSQLTNDAGYLTDDTDKADVIVNTASGAIASFTDGGDNLPVQDLVVQIEPVQAGSGDPSPDNVRPITGWTGAKVTRTGKNLFETKNVGRTYSDVTYTLINGQIELTGTASATSFLYGIPSSDMLTKIPAGSYILSGGISSNIRLVATTYTVSENTVTKVADVATDLGSGATFTLTEDTWVGVNIRVQSGQATNVTIGIQIEVGATVTAYEPYQGETYDITFPSEAGTVYGGSLDVTTGVLTVDRVMVTFIGSENIQAATNGNRFFCTQNDAIQVNASNQLTERSVISDRYKSVTWGGLGSSSGNMCCAPVYGKGIAFRDDTLTTVDMWKAYFTDNPTQFSYKLATPQTYQLTPTEIRTLLGQNNIWADTGDAAVTYRADTKMFIEQNAPESPVQDVQVAGVSVLSDGVANVPIGNDTNPGVFKTGGYGVGVYNYDLSKLCVKCAQSNQIKAGSDSYMPIVPSKQHESTFYGLAKAAGADMKDIANTTVGTYPDAQKEAIQSMLGITQMLAPTNPNLVASQAYSIGDVFATNGHLYKATAAIAQDEAIIPDTNCVETTMVDAGGKIKDVQVAGSSIVGNDGVANIPTGGSNSNKKGVVWTNGTAWGIRIYESPGWEGAISIVQAEPNIIKTGNNGSFPITSMHQHDAVYYGLSKVAGVDLANETVTLGTYPETSKTAIKEMLGVQDGLKVVRLI